MFPLLLATRGQAASSASVVWYRASEGCPAGQAFLEKLWAKAPLARLMQAGDHIDFVVTLVAEQGETIGRLERQTDNGTVAIRELRDPVCERVADALALSLALSLEAPKASTAPTDGNVPSPSESSSNEAKPAPSELAVSAAAPKAEPTDKAKPTDKATSGNSKLSVEKPQGPADRGNAATPDVLGKREVPSKPVASESASGSQGALGLEGGALLGAAPNALVRAGVYLEVAQLGLALDPRLSLRVGAVGALGSSDTSVGPIHRSILAGRAEGCPWRFGTEAFGVSPCAALELGATGASAARTKASATDTWFVAAGGVRARLLTLPRLALEAQIEAQFPLIRTQVDAGSVSVYRADPVGFQGGLSLSWRLW
ncbi:MAG: hypothetical protein SFV15_23735 [Polyangiaceae bacterium]|nr:hypothetical protein [Polyangiaceae bacterium]